jgi:hypothetical protein
MPDDRRRVPDERSISVAPAQLATPAPFGARRSGAVWT